MIYFIIIIGILIFVKIKWNPYLDIFKDYRDKNQIIIWYNKGKERKYFNLGSLF